MIYRFEDFELDTATFELRRNGSAIPAEPQVLSLLFLLVGNCDRLVGKDEIIETIWEGRIVSDAAVSSRIKSIRKLLDDDGRQQRLLRTVHGKGFRFVGAVAVAAPAAAQAISAEQGTPRGQSVDAQAAPPVVPPVPPAGGAKPSIAVLPFRLIGVAGSYAPLADALPHELILELARSRWIFVIARGSSFRFRESDPDLQEIGKALQVRYCLSGVVDIVGDRMTVTVELAETRDGGIIWCDRYSDEVGAVHEIRERIVANVVSALELLIPLNEARQARLTRSPHLDAWSAYHLGLDHMYRFNRTDNARAAALFEQALTKDPGFARAHAGLSFTRFQNAFLRYSDDVERQIAGAREAAEAAVANDPLDPFANLVLGRAHWIEGDLSASLAWLERATQISPHYAHGVYLRGMSETLSGRGAAAGDSLDLAMQLSPLDPLRYAMLSTRALSLIVQDRFGEAAQWSERAAHSPGAHVHISLVAALAHHLAGERDSAERWAREARQRDPSIGAAEFLRAFPFGEAAQRGMIERGLKALGF